MLIIKLIHSEKATKFSEIFTALLFREKSKKLEQQTPAADTEIKKTYPTKERKLFFSLLGRL